MVVVQVEVTKGVDELTDFQATYVGNHVSQQRVACNVKRHTQEDVGAALVQLTAQLTIVHMELEHRVTWWQCHFFYINWVPC